MACAVRPSALPAWSSLTHESYLYLLDSWKSRNLEIWKIGNIHLKNTSPRNRPEYLSMFLFNILMSLTYMYLHVYTTTWILGFFLGKVEIWKSGNLEIWKSGNLEIWKSGNLEIYTRKILLLEIDQILFPLFFIFWSSLTLILE